MQTKIPSFLSKKFNECETKVQRDEFIQRLNNWRSLEFTEELLNYLDESVQTSMAEEDKQSSFVSLFQSKYHAAGKKAERNLLRRLYKLIKG